MENVYMIAAGGTGGHFYPGFALGKNLIERGHDVVFIIKKDSPSAKVLEENEILYQEIDCMGMPRSINIFKWISFCFKLLGTMLKIRKIIKNLKPVVCVGMGGYISFPLVYTAHLMGIKTVVHDSNAKIGLANRICARYTDMFLMGLPTEDKIKKGILVGTPVREEFMLRESVEEHNYWTLATGFSINVLIFGGSQGARNLNFAAAKTALDLLEKSDRIHFIHLTGIRDYREIKALYNKNPNVVVMPYADDMHALMKTSHFIISRAGASSLAEIISLKKPSILVPYPYASDNHQYYNAKILTDKGCAVLINETENLSYDLETVIKKVLASPDAIKNMSANFDNSQLPDPLEAANYASSLIEKLVSAKNYEDSY